MDSRTAAHALNQIAAYLELLGESRFKSRAYGGAAKAVLAFGAEDLGPALRSGELAEARGLGPATLSVIRDLVEVGESRYLEQLRRSAPDGLLEMLGVPGLSALKIHQIHEALGIETLDELEDAAGDGRLAALPRWGPKTAAKILQGISFQRRRRALVLYPLARDEAARLVAMVRAHPAVVQAEIGGSVRRRCEVVADIDIVAGCTGAPEQVAASFTRTSGVRDAATISTTSVAVTYVDGTRFTLHCADRRQFAVALWRATGNSEHEALVRERLATRELAIAGDELLDRSRAVLPIPTEGDLYTAAGMQYVEPELREGGREVEAAGRHELPRLIELQNLQGVLHCHSNYSDGTTSIAEMARAARERGWSYLGVSDHSQAAVYAGGVSRDRIRIQHDEIDEVNAATTGFRVLKGIEADILADGRIDYDAELLDRFDYVIGSIHSRFAMDQPTMTARVLAALDDPHLTILGHPTGRLLLHRESYPIDIDAVVEKAAATGVAIELNADPHRLDVDWRLLPSARERGVMVEIGPDAHSVKGFDNVEFGIGVARKGWLEPSGVLNAGTADDVLAFARARRAYRR